MILKRIFRKLKSVIVKPKDINKNIFIGSNTSVDPTAILNASGSSKLVLEGSNYIGRNVEIGPLSKIEIGRHASVQDRCIILGDVEIGAGTLFAPNVYISSGRHYYDLIPYWNIKDQDEFVQANADLAAKHSKKVTIGEDCWIGINAVIMSGVHIGKGCIIGANSVVTKNIAPYTIVGGIPSKPIKTRLDFKPPSVLNYISDETLPYFYKGFFTRQADLQTDRKLGGIACGLVFQLALNANEAQYLFIEAVNISGSEVALSYNGQTNKIKENQTQILQFNVDKKSEIHSFNTNNLAGVEKVLLIKNIKLD